MRIFEYNVADELRWLVGLTLGPNMAHAPLFGVSLGVTDAAIGSGITVPSSACPE